MKYLWERKERTIYYRGSYQEYTQRDTERESERERERNKGGEGRKLEREEEVNKVRGRKGGW